MNFNRCIIIVISLIAISSSVVAQPASEAQLRELAKVSGVYEQMNEVKDAMTQQASQMATGLINQIKARNPNLPPEAQSQIDAEVRSQFQKMPTYFDVDTIVSKYVELMTPQLNDAEVEKIISFFESKEGQKYVESNTVITPQLSQAMSADFQPKLLADMKSFSENLRKIVNKSKNNH